MNSNTMNGDKSSPTEILGDQALKTTFSQHKTRFNPHDIRAQSTNTRLNISGLQRKRNPFRRASPQESLGQKREKPIGFQNMAGLQNGAEVNKKFKSASLNSQGVAPQ